MVINENVSWKLSLVQLQNDPFWNSQLVDWWLQHGSIFTLWSVRWRKHEHCVTAYWFCHSVWRRLRIQRTKGNFDYWLLVSMFASTQWPLTYSQQFLEFCLTAVVIWAFLGDLWNWHLCSTSSISSTPCYWGYSIIKFLCSQGVGACAERRWNPIELGLPSHVTGKPGGSHRRPLSQQSSWESAGVNSSEKCFQWDTGTLIYHLARKILSLMPFVTVKYT